MLNLSHKKLTVWRKSVELVTEIYSITAKFPLEEKYGLISQLRRSSVSVPSNISEGASRASVKERNRFYEIARSSLVEIDTQIEISKALNYIKPEEDEKLNCLANEVFAMLTAMKQY